jgi:peptidoglycan-N-acetylglucosamine deacetylase
MNKIKLLPLLTLLTILATGCATSTPLPAATLEPTATATLTPTSTPTLVPTATVTPSPTPIPAVLLTNGDRAAAFVALTFDVCQEPAYPAGYDAAIVSILERYNVPATFFMGGDWMRTHPDETLQLASHPLFELGNHSWDHADFTTLNVDQIHAEITQTDDLLFQLTSRHSRLFRLPYGTYTDETLQTISQMGFYTIQWDSATGDPDPNFDAATILGEVQRTVQNGSIIIMHANGRGWHTAEALPAIIEYLQARGFQLVTISQLLGIP